MTRPDLCERESASRIQGISCDEDAVYAKTYEIDLGEIRPTIAFPHLPENTRTVDEIKEDIKIDQVVIGSCTNGRISDMQARRKY